MIKLILAKDKKVELKNGKWKCAEDKTFQRLLNLRYTADNITFYSPFLDLDIAKIAIKEWGGKITKIIDAPKFIKGRIY